MATAPSYVSNTFMLNSKFELFSKKLISSICLIISDLGTISAALLGIFLLHTQNDGLDASLPILIFLSLAAVACIYFLTRGHYQRRIPFWDEASEILKSSLLLALLQGTIIGLTTDYSAPLVFVAAWPITGVMLVSMRCITKLLMMRAQIWQLPTVIIGNGPNAVDTARAIMEEKLLGYEIITFLSVDERHDRQITVGNETFSVRCFGDQPEKFLRRLGSPHVIVALEKGGLNEIQHYFDRLTFWYPKISVVPALRGLPLFGTEMYHFFSHEVLILNFKNNLGKFTSRVVKRMFDIVGSALLIAVLSPVFVYLAYKVRQTGKTVIYGHKRVGQGGQLFKCLKFRSMVENSQEVLQDLLEKCPKSRKEWERDFKLKDDPRITELGQFLRKSSLDELPQLFNVLRGNMSLVGPRPVTKEEIERYGDKASFYYKAKPGITGLWQVSGRNDIDYDSRVDLDVWYVRNWSIWNDIVILIRTVTVVFNRSGAY